MPCRDDGAETEAHNDLRKRHQEFVNQVCQACKHLEKNGAPIPPSLSGWWLKHKQEDRARKWQEVLNARQVLASKERDAADHTEAIKAAALKLAQLENEYKAGA